jgi:hypothetical protein
MSSYVSKWQQQNTGTIVVAALSAYVSRLQQQNHRGLANMRYIGSRLQQKRNPETRQL